MESAILVGTHALDELRELATSAGARIIDEVIQHRDRPDPATFIGKGKVEELHEEVVVEGVDVVIFDHELSPGQAKNLEEALDTKVVDRTALILDIFARRARSKEGKLQVELAQLEYRLTRLAGYRDYLSRLGGGIGTRGPGETKLEMDRRQIRHRISTLKRESSRFENTGNCTGNGAAASTFLWFRWSATQMPANRPYFDLCPRKTRLSRNACSRLWTR